MYVSYNPLSSDEWTSILSWVGMGKGGGGGCKRASFYWIQSTGGIVYQKFMLWWILFQPPHVSCETKIWHPNISENGEVCLRYVVFEWCLKRILFGILFQKNSWIWLYTVINLLLFWPFVDKYKHINPSLVLALFYLKLMFNVFFCSVCWGNTHLMVLAGLQLEN